MTSTLGLVVVMMYVGVVVSQGSYDSDGNHMYPDNFNQRCTCVREDNFYSVKTADNCGSFTQRTAFLPAKTLYCPAGLQFDVKSCVCAYPKDTVCPTNCPAGSAAVQAPATTRRTCQRNGSIYAVVSGSNCAKFTQETSYLPPQVHHCPAGLMFDYNICVCNYPSQTDCYDH